jgi:ketosteroid isomerase-like protein
VKATLFVVFTLAACATATSDIERQIRAQYDVLEAAFERQDIPAILAMRDPRFETFGPQGQRDDYERMAEYTRQWFVMNKPPIETSFTIESIEILAPDEAAVRVLQRASRMQDRDGVLRRVEHEVRQRETWIRTAEGWKLRKVDEIDLINRKRWIDGEPEAVAVEREIRARYDAIERAYTAQDVDAILANFDPGLQISGFEGEHFDHASFSALLREKWFVMNKPPIEFRVTIESVEMRSAGEVAVRVLQRASRYQQRAGRLAHVVHEVRQRESWIRTSEGWKLRTIDEIDYPNRKVWEDGVPVPLEKQSPPQSP